MANPIANLFDDFNDGTISSKWTTSGTWTEASGNICATMPSAGASLTSAAAYSFRQSSAFVEIVSYANGAGAASGAELFRLFNSADSNDYVQFVLDPPSNTLFFQYVENAVIISSSSITYNATTMRWLRFRQGSGLVYFETSPDGATWTQRFTSTAQTWIDSVKALLFAAQSGGAATTKCFDNFNVAPVSARAVPVGSEFTISADGKLGLNRCDQSDVAWPFSCSQSAYNALRRSENPCGLWVQPPAKQFLQVETSLLSSSDSGEQTVITLDLTNPDTCRSMLFYLPFIGGMRLLSTKADTGSVVSWTLGVEATGVDNPDSGFQPLIADDIGSGFDTASHFWRGVADYYWTAAPGATTSIEIKLKGFSGDSGIELTQLTARLGIIGMSVMAP